MDWMTMIMWIFLSALVGVLGWYAYVTISQPYSVRIREMTSNKVRLIHDLKGRIKKDDEGIEFLRLSKKIGEIRDIPIPPKEVIDYNPKRKKKVVEAWYSEEEGIIYVKDEGLIEGLNPFTTKQRQMMVNQLHKKESRKSKRWQDHIPLIVGLTSLVIIVTVVLVFWGDAIAPINQAAETSAQALDKADQLYERLIAWEEGRQIMEQEDIP